MVQVAPFFFLSLAVLTEDKAENRKECNRVQEQRSKARKDGGEGLMGWEERGVEGEAKRLLCCLCLRCLWCWVVFGGVSLRERERERKGSSAWGKHALEREAEGCVCTGQASRTAKELNG
jgi:hypothetical protein